jgi:hypothetical protein
MEWTEAMDHQASTIPPGEEGARSFAEALAETDDWDVFTPMAGTDIQQKSVPSIETKIRNPSGPQELNQKELSGSDAPEMEA